MSNIIEPFIKIVNIIHKYNGKEVLNISELSFLPGKIFALVGPNGSGKTTLLNILGLLLKPSSGRVLFEGKDVYSHPSLLPHYRNRITTVIQNPVLFDTTVEKNIEYGLKVRCTAKEERKRIVKECLEMVRLDGLQKRRARELSGGEAQRVAIARALAIKPQVLFLDEFASHMDEQSVEVLNEVIKATNQRCHTTVFLVTHNTLQAYNLADEVVNLFEGRVVDSSLQNLFRGKVRKVNNLSVFDTGTVTMEVITDREGSAFAVIPPQDIIVSFAPLSSSARNSFYGVVNELHDGGTSVSLNVAAGELFRVKMTKESFKEMGLTVGSRVYITFKSTAVVIF